jgi:hypothetical protein
MAGRRRPSGKADKLADLPETSPIAPRFCCGRGSIADVIKLSEPDIEAA